MHHIPDLIDTSHRRISKNFDSDNSENKPVANKEAGVTSVVERLLIAGRKYDDRRCARVMEEDSSRRMASPQINKRSRELAKDLEPIYKRSTSACRHMSRSPGRKSRSDASPSRKPREDVSPSRDTVVIRAKTMQDWDVRRKVKLQDSRERLEAEELSKCTFQPRIESTNRLRQKVSPNFRERLEVSKFKKDEKLRQLSETCKLKEAAECTHVPKTNFSSTYIPHVSPSGSGSREGSSSSHSSVSPRRGNRTNNSSSSSSISLSGAGFGDLSSFLGVRNS